MPHYTYRCPSCRNEHDRLFAIGEAPRVQTCDCGKPAHLVIGAAVQIAPSALEVSGQRVRAVDARENRWHRDMPAYKRMRDKGMQPRSVDGAADLENKVGDQLDLNMQALYAQGISRERIIEGHEQAAEIMDAAANQ